MERIKVPRPPHGRGSSTSACSNDMICSLPELADAKHLVEDQKTFEIAVRQGSGGYSRSPVLPPQRDAWTLCPRAQIDLLHEIQPNFLSLLSPHSSSSSESSFTLAVSFLLHRATAAGGCTTRMTDTSMQVWKSATAISRDEMEKARRCLLSLPRPLSYRLTRQHTSLVSTPFQKKPCHLQAVSHPDAMYAQHIARDGLDLLQADP